MADNGVIDIVLKPSLDTKEIQSEMRQIAQTSKTAVEQSFKGLELTMRKSMEAWGKDVKIGKNVNMDEFVDEFREKMKELNNEIIETGNLPLGMTSKIFSAEQAVESLIEKYYKLQRVLGSMPDEEKYTETNRYAKMAEDLDKIQQKYNGAQGTIQRLEQEYANLQEREQLVASVGGQQVVDAYNKQIAKITELEEKIRDLKDLQGADTASGINRGLTGKALEENRRQIEEYQKQIDKTRNIMRLFGNDTIETLERIKTLEGSISPEVMSGGKDYVSQEIDARKQKMIDYMMQIDKLKAKLAELEQSGGRYRLSDEYKQTTEEIRRLEIEIVKAATGVNELNEKAKKTTGSFAQWRNVVWSISRVLGNIYTLGLDIVRGAKMIANFYKKIWSYVQRVANAFKKLRDHIKKTNDEHAKSWKQMLKDVIRYSLGIRSLFMLFRRLRKYIREAFEAMAEQIPEVNQSLSELKSSFNMLKGSLGTAFEPIVSALTPALLKLIDLFAKLLTYVGMFFAALSGRGYVFKANKSMTSFADATGEAADNAKELNKQLQGFDELNNLTTKDNKDTGGGAGPLANFEKVPVPDWIKDLADKLKEIFEKIVDPIKKAWAKVGDYVIAAWKRTAKALKELLSDVLRDFLKAWESWGEPIFVRIFQIVGDIGMIIGNLAIKLREAWNENDNGLKIWNAILEIIYKVVDGIRQITLSIFDWTNNLNLSPAMTAFREWLESCIPVVETFMNVLLDFWNDALKPILTWAFDGENSGVAKFFNIFRDFNQTVDWEKLRTNLDKIWQALGRFGQKVGEGLLEFIDRMADRLANWVNSDDFAETCDKIVEFLDSVDSSGIADDLEQVLTIIQNVAGWVWKAIKYVIDNKDTILDFIEKLSEHLDTIAKIAVFGKLGIDIARFAANLVLLGGSIAKAVSGMESIGGMAGVIDKVKLAFAGLAPEVIAIIAIIGALVGIFVYLYNTSDEFREKVNNAITEVKEAFSTFMENLQPSIDHIKELIAPFIDDILSKLEILFGFIVDSLGPLVSFVGGIIDAIVALVDGLFSLLTGDFEGFKSAMVRVGQSLWEALKGAIQIFINWVKAVFNLFGVEIVDVFNKIKSNVINVWNNIKSGVSNALSSISSRASSFKSSFIGIFNSIGSGIKSAINGVLGSIEGMVNGVVAGINGAINAINGMHFTVPSWIPQYGGNSISFNIPNVSGVRIPRLAEGAVIPPNNEFLAVLGDQKKGTNIETPLDTMVQAFNMANKGGNEQELSLLQEQNDLLRQLLDKEFGISNDAIFRSVKSSAKIYKRATGNNAFA